MSTLFNDVRVRHVDSAPPGPSVQHDFDLHVSVLCDPPYLSEPFLHLSRPAVDKMNQMLGSYGPRKEEHTHLTPLEDAPSGQHSSGGGYSGVHSLLKVSLLS